MLNFKLKDSVLSYDYDVLFIYEILNLSIYM